jgi:hypothetical protein
MLTVDTCRLKGTCTAPTLNATAQHHTIPHSSIFSHRYSSKFHLLLPILPGLLVLFFVYPHLSFIPSPVAVSSCQNTDLSLSLSLYVRSVLFSSRLALGPTQTPIQWVTGIKRTGHEADYSPSSSPKVQNAWSYTTTLPYVFMTWYLVKHKSDSSVGIALGYGMDDRGSRVRFPAGVGNFSVHHRVQNGSGAHPASYPMGTRGSFPGGKATGSWSWPLTSI